MVKILVANENTEQNNNFCQYLKNDNTFFTSSVNTGIEALNKYNEINPHVLILGSHFNDMESTEIIDRLSSTVDEKRNSNIILMINNINEQNLFLDVKKIYKFFEISKLDEFVLYKTIKQMDNENKFDDFTDKQLNVLLSSMYIIVTSPHTKLLIEAIKECYYNSNLCCKLGEVMNIISYKHNGYSVEAIQSSFRRALAPVNYNREKLQHHPVVKLIDPTKNISPRVFLETITEYLYVKNNQDIEF